jgi:hypothetical protein
MRKIALQLRDFVKEDFSWGTYGATILFLGICIVLNYRFDFADTFLYAQKDGWPKLLSWMAMMAFPYLVVLGLQAIFQQPALGLKQAGFWGMLLLGIAMVSVTAWFPWHKTMAKIWFPQALHRWGILVLWNLKRLVFMFLPMLLYWWLADRKHSRFYGFFEKPKHLGPYFLLLLLVLPLVVWASFQPDFLRAYPQYFAGHSEAKIGVSPWLTGGIFELIYGADFAFVELTFRGFLVIGMVRWLGTRAVLPMAAMYCVLHFGKPMGEAIGSVFGGYILGVIALRSRSIWGGIVVHLGLAWMMEAAAYMQRAHLFG